MTENQNNKSTIDQDIAKLDAAMQRFVSNLSSDDMSRDEAVADLQATYRTIHQTRHGKVQAAVLPKFPTVMADAFDAFANLPAAPSSRVTKPTLTDAEKSMVRVYLTDIVSSVHIPTVDPEGVWNDAMVEALTTAIGRITKVIGNLPIGSTDKAVYDRSADALLSIAPAGSVLTGNLPKDAGTVEAVVNADGTITFGTDTGSLSAVAKVVLGRNQNGWDFWRIGGTVLAKVAAND